ncbi:bifunctional hydroxymethylpyrimidine kinase/phosphomethylpyrimidine kinase [Candidatus Caldatribacterium sp. SIUC1]|uniref:bifunctional hydroxymethylpyrimidine kinase/phosphomethylpyrimidine kinase n=1 Tax=Candidatus Caldatribacterium sp. SIUC1 TaxID=3418365 RepID=UPI003F68FD3F
MRRVLTIAGSDSGGGAGIQADLKTFCAFGVYGMTAITAVTAQNTKGVDAIFPLPPSMVAQQVESIMEDIGVDAVKTGMLFSEDIIRAVVQALRKWPVEYLVVDPVMVAKSKAVLLEEQAIQALVQELLPLAHVVTPNLEEASVLAGFPVQNLRDMEDAARRIREKGPRYVLVKGGHLPGSEVTDVLFDGKDFTYFSGPRIATPNTHGTGCTYSAAICALLALGYTVKEAVAEARRYMELVIAHALPLGGGFGPTNHLAPLFLRAGLDPQEGGRCW